MILNDAEIEAAMQQRINSVWPPAKREKVLRTGIGKAELDAFFLQMSDEKLAMIAARDEELRLAEEARLVAEAIQATIDLQNVGA